MAEILNWLPDPMIDSEEAVALAAMKADKSTDIEDWGASFRQNVVGMRSMQIEHEDRNLFSTFIHDTFGIYDKKDYSLDKMGKDAQDIIKTVPVKYQREVYEQENLADMKHKAAMINSDLDDEAVMATESLPMQLAMGMVAMPIDPLTYAVFGLGAVGKVGSLMRVAYGPANAGILRKSAVTAAQGAVEGGVSEMLIKNASTEDYSGVPASAAMSAVFAGGVHGAAGLVQRHGGNAQREILDKMQNEEMDISTDRENVIESMKILDSSPVQASFKKIFGIPVAKWMSKSTANRVTGRWTSSDMNTIIAESTDPTKAADGAGPALKEIAKHDTTHIGLETKDGKDVVQDKTNVQDIKYEHMYYNIKLEMARGKTYNDYTMDWEKLSPSEKENTPKMNQQDWSIHMHSLRARLFDEYNNYKATIDNTIRKDTQHIEAAEKHVEAKIQEKIAEYDVKMKAKDKKYQPPVREEVDDVVWSQYMEDIFGGRDKIDDFKEGWEESYYRNEATKQARETHESTIELKPYEKEFIDSGNEYYGGKADVMKKNGLDEYNSFDSYMYNPRTWKAEVISRDKEKAYTDFEEAIRDSQGYKLMFQDAQQALDEAIAIGNDTPEMKAKIKQLTDDIKVLEEKIAEQESMTDAVLVDTVYNNIINNRPFHVDVVEGKNELDIGSDEFHLGDYVDVAWVKGKHNGFVGRIQGFTKDDHAIVLADNGAIVRVSPMDMDNASWTRPSFYDNFSKTRARHNVEKIGDIFSKEERGFFRKGFFQRKDVQTLWNAAGRPEVKLLHTTGPRAENSLTAGYYIQGRNEIRVMTAGNDKVDMERTFMHELIHVLTVQQMEIDPAFKADIDDIYRQLREADVQPNRKQRYGFTDPREMVSEMFANPDFIALMKTIPAKNKYGAKTGESLFDTIIDKILKLAHKMLGGKRDGTLHDAAMDVFYNFERKIDESAQYKAADMAKIDMDIKRVSDLRNEAINVALMDENKVDNLTRAQWYNLFEQTGRSRDQADAFLDTAHEYNLADDSAQQWFDIQLDKLKKDASTYYNIEKAELAKEVGPSFEAMLVEARDLAENSPRNQFKIDLMNASVKQMKDELDLRMKELDEAPSNVKAARAEMSRVQQYPKKAAKGTVDKITAPEAKTIANASSDGQVKAFGRRTVNVDETHPAIANYMHKNEATIQQMYDYKTTGKIATQEVFGTIDRAEYEKYIKENVTSNARYVSMLGDMFDRGLGTKQLPADMNDGFERFARTVSNYNYITMGGQFAKYGLAEMGATIHSVGFRGLMQSIPAFRETIAMYKKGYVPSAAQEANLRLADAGEIYKGNNMAALGDPQDIASTFAGENMGAFDKVEGWSKKMSQWMFRGSGLEAGTVWTKLVLPKAFMGRILDQVSRGRLDARSMQDMSRWGLSPDDLVAISKENWKANESGFVDDFNLDNWKDAELSKRFQRAVHRMSRDTIMRPDANRLPNWLTDGSVNPIIKMAKQFMSFMFLSHERLMMRGLNERQGHAAMAVLGSFMFLAMFETIAERVAIATGLLKEKDAYYTSDDPEKFKEAMKRLATLNSYAGLGPTATEFAELFFGDGYGNKARTLGKVAGGPALTRINSGKRALSDIIDGKYGDKAVVDFARTSVPFTNILGLDYLMKERIFRDDRLED